MQESASTHTPDIFGEAIRAYYFQQDPENIIVHSPDFDDDIIPVPYLFRNQEEMPPIEQIALSHCRGKVLDVGCGAGSHSLYLQDIRKLDVTALDSSVGATEVCRLRGIMDVQHASFSQFRSEPYDTLLFLMNGTGFIGRLNQIDAFFAKIKELLHPEGQVLIDSSDLSFLFDRDQDGGIWMDLSKDYYGEITYQLSYKNLTSAPFKWLYLDFHTLQLACAKNGFECELIQEGEHYDYLARLSLNQ